jgi:3-oxoacyl-[acyl-carrier protein] reductase
MRHSIDTTSGMTDSYLSFANSSLGSSMTRLLGLPRPVILERFKAHQPTIEGDVLVGAAPGAELLPAMLQAFCSMKAHTLSHHSLPSWTAMANRAGLLTGPWGVAGQPGSRVKALVFDATGLCNAQQTDVLYQFFHDAVRQVSSCGRVVVLGRPPELLAEAQQVIVQRALEGFIRALAKEVKRGITVQLIYVSPGAEDRLEGPLRFFLSPRSAYVSAQVIRLSATVTGQAACIWDMPLAGKKLLVTGASRGIGASIAETLARDGAQVVCLDVPSASPALQDIAARLKGTALPMDITDPQTPQQLVELALADGGWDGVVHNAGITRDKTIANMPQASWQSVIQVNLLAQEAIHQALMNGQAFRANARMVCVSSISGIAGNMGQTNYAFSKAGVIGLVHSHAKTLAATGMAINAVAPGFIETPMTAAMPWVIREAGRRMNSLGQGGQPVDVAETIAWLLSSASTGVHGEVIRVCGQSWLGA